MSARPLEVPQRLLEARERRHQHGPAAVEAAAIGHLPDVLDAERVVTDEAVAKRREGAVHCLGMTFEARFAPAYRAFVRFDADEQPAGGDGERLYLADLHA